MAAALEPPELSICIRATRAQYLPEAIASALAQTFTDLEVVVADDAGDLEEVARAFRDPRVRYHRLPPPHGSAPALWAAFDLAEGSLVAMLDDDDTLLPDFARTAIDRLQADPAVDIVFTNHFLTAGTRVWTRPTLLAPGRTEPFLETLLRTQPVAIGAHVLRRRVWETVRRPPIDHDALAELELWIRAAIAGFVFEYVDEPLMLYRVYGEQQTNTRSRSRGVALWRRFEFDDPACESLRLELLASAEIAYAAELLKARHGRDALAALARARSAQPRTERVRRRALSVLARVPTAVPAALVAWSVWRRLMPYRHPTLAPRPAEGS